MQTPIRGLRSFCFAARTLSFKDAANQLYLTPSAVSHQIKILEEWLGTPLFVRLTRAIKLTAAGEMALPMVTDGFDRLSDGVALMQSKADENLLTISVSPGFGSLWLLPRLEKFRRHHPDIEIRIDGTDRLVDIARGEADVAIRYGPGGYQGVKSHRLFGMRATPFCSPALLESGPPLNLPGDLIHHTLLHVDWKEDEGSWRTWLLAAGADSVDPYKGPRFTKEEMAVRAALNGEGVALIGDHMAEDHLRSGRLVQPFSSEMSTPMVFAYFLLTPTAGQAKRKINAFRDWLLAEVD